MKTIKNNLRKKASLSLVMVVMFFMSSFEEVKAISPTLAQCRELASYVHTALYKNDVGANRNTIAVAAFTWRNQPYIFIAGSSPSLPARGTVTYIDPRTGQIRDQTLTRLEVVMFFLREMFGDRALGGSLTDGTHTQVVLVSGITDGSTGMLSGFASEPILFEFGIYRRLGVFHAEMAVEYMINRYIGPGNTAIPNINIAANRPYCRHCNLYLTRNPGFNIIPGFTANVAVNTFGRPYVHPYQMARINPNYPQLDLRRLYLGTTRCRAGHNTIGLPPGSGGKTTEFTDDDLLTEDNHNHLEGEDLEKESIDALETNAEQKLAVFPNPILDNAIIKCFDCIKGSSISIYDVTGSLKREIKWNDNGGKSMPLDMSNFSKGLYFLKTENPNGVTKTTKLVKN
jgi:Secretion system C-terminal sorting domain